MKPDDWDENEPRQIIDEFATMPDGWLEDENDMIADPVSVQCSFSLKIACDGSHGTGQ